MSLGELLYGTMECHVSYRGFHHSCFYQCFQQVGKAYVLSVLSKKTDSLLDMHLISCKNIIQWLYYLSISPSAFTFRKANITSFHISGLQVSTASSHPALLSVPISMLWVTRAATHDLIKSCRHYQPHHCSTGSQVTWPYVKDHGQIPRNNTYNKPMFLSFHHIIIQISH